MRLPIPSITLESGGRKPIMFIFEEGEKSVYAHHRFRMQSRCLHILRDGQIVAVPIGEWIKWFEVPANRQVERTELDEGVWISTVFLGTPPLFETMIFGGSHDNKAWRSKTIEDARMCHAAAVKLVKEQTT